MTAPSSRYRLRSSRRCGVTAKPATTAAARNQIVHLASAATPAHSPMASHQRGSPLSSSRSTRYSRIAQATKSGVVVLSRCMAPRNSAQPATHTAASTCPARPAPRMRLMPAVSSTSALSPSAGSTRSPTRELANSNAARRAASGVSGG